MTSKPKIILTSDDYGLSSLNDVKILEMLELEYLTSVSVMVKRISNKKNKQFSELINISERKNISIGLHLEFSEQDIINDVESQFNRFKDYLGVSPDYIDIHKNSHFKGDYNILAEFCHHSHIAFRKYPLTTSVVASPNLSVIATNMAIENIESMIDRFEGNKIYEIIFHIGTYDPYSKSKLNKERELDVKKLIQVHQIIKKKKMILTNFKFVQ